MKSELLADKLSIAVVDDDKPTADLVATQLRKMGFTTSVFTDPGRLLAALKTTPADIVITDLRMPTMDGLDLIKQVREQSLSTDVIVISGSSNKKDAIQALKLGAFDFFEKPVDPDELVRTITRTVRYRAVVAERNQLAEQVSYLSGKDAEKWGIDAFIGKSKGIREVLRSIRALQKAGDTSVLVTGESGTGKELVARAIHYGGPRGRLPFVAVNCSAVPADLAESTLFGHVRGAFTGAAGDKPGLFVVADRGTLFLDEIGDMPSVMQAKLLRVLEDGRVTPVGGTTERKVDVRIIAATNSDLKARVSAGTFRSDLYFRLAGYALSLPPLRERNDDIPLLIEHFMVKLSAEMGFPAPSILPEALSILQQHSFPGNVRELKNTVERALIESGGHAVGPAHIKLLDIALPGSPARLPGAPFPGAASTVPPSDSLNLRDVESSAIRRAMAASQGNVTRAARLLGIGRTKLYRRLTAMGETTTPQA